MAYWQRQCLMVLVSGWLVVGLCASPTTAEPIGQRIFAGQRRLEVRSPSQLPQAPLPQTPAPATVAQPSPAAPTRQLTLDQTLRLALEHSEVVRVLAGTTAVASGSTIYDPAITNTTIAQQQGRFDPTVSQEI